MAEKPVLLLVDDNEDMLETLSDILREKGYQIETAQNGREAIKKAKERFFNIALIDMKMPDMTGIEVLKTFRKKYPSRMNVMVTAYANLQNTMDALNLGANAYIMKPVDHKRLDEIIVECLKKQQEALKMTQEKLSEFMEEAMENMLERDGQRWPSQAPKAIEV